MECCGLHGTTDCELVEGEQAAGGVSAAKITDIEGERSITLKRVVCSELPSFGRKSFAAAKEEELVSFFSTVVPLAGRWWGWWSDGTLPVGDALLVVDEGSIKLASR